MPDSTMLTLIHFLCLFHIARTGAQATQKTIPIPLSTDAERRYVMQLDMAKQRYKFALSMSTGYCVVAGTECSSCQTDTKYNLSASPLAGEITGMESVQIIGGSLSGGIMQENCSFIPASGPSWDYFNHPMLLANESNSLITPGISGILGLGMNRNNGDFNSSGIGMWLSRNPSASNFSFGLRLDTPTASSQNGGTLDWLAPDQTAYEGDVAWKTITTAPDANINSDWIIEFDAWNISVPKSSSTSRSGQMNAIVEPYVPSLVFPYGEAMAIYNRIAGANKNGTTITSNLWKVPCETRMSLTVTFGTHSFSINEDYLVQNLNGSCWGTIEGWMNETETMYLLGSSFVSSVYLIASASGADQGSLGFAKRASLPTKLQTGTIAGITLGSVACATLLCIGLLQAYKYWKIHSPSYKQLKQQEAVQPFVLSPTAIQVRTSLTPVRSYGFLSAKGEQIPLHMLPSPPITTPDSHVTSYDSEPLVFGVPGGSRARRGYSDSGYSATSTTPSTSAFSGDGQVNSIFTTQNNENVDTPPPYTRTSMQPRAGGSAQAQRSPSEELENETLRSKKGGHF